MRLLALLGCVISLALVAAGCGGGDDSSASSADEWADEFCTTVENWTDDLTQIGEELGDVSWLSTESLEEAADDADAATQDFIDALRDLGAPDTESGDAVEQELEELADAVEAEREELREAVDDADGLGGIADAVGTLGSSISTMGTALQQTLEALDSADPDDELEQALEDSEACDALTN